jgi:prepilin signal peptidase PulO-like enzyme (type II secretory pathway)
MDMRFLKGLAIIIFILSFLAPIIYGSSFEFHTNRIPDEIIYPLCWMGGLFSGIFWLTMAEILKKLEQLKSAELYKIEKIEEICRKLPK